MIKRKDPHWFYKIGDYEEISIEQAKKVFFHFGCSLGAMHKEWLNSNKFTELNISSETLTTWTTQYYDFDILMYDSLDLTDKLFYMLNLMELIDQFTKKFFFKVIHMYLELLNNEETFYSFFKAPNIIIDSVFNYNEYFSTFNGIFVKLYQYQEFELLDVFLNIMIDTILKFENKFLDNKKEIYKHLMLFNDTYNLSYKTLLDKLK